jgi:hypothetical protein
VISSPPVTEEIGAMGREIEARQGIGRVVALKNNNMEMFNEMCNLLFYIGIVIVRT